MSNVYNGRIAAVKKEGQPLALAWAGNIRVMDYWVLVKGAPNRERAYDFLKFASQSEPQQAFAKLTAYGPVNQAAAQALSTARIPDLPTEPANMADSLAFDAQFWHEHAEELEERFNAWAAR